MRETYEAGQRNVALIVGRYLLVAVLILFWMAGFPFHSISTFIGAHFPWPVRHTWKWAAALTEGASIQILATIPFGILLAIAFPRRAEWVAVLLSAIFCLHVLEDSAHVSHAPSTVAFLIYMALTHFVFLTGTTVLSRRLRLSRVSQVGATI
jgi:hypothetical protein